MADVEALTDIESQLWDYIREHDFDANPWVTADVAEDMDMTVDGVYATLSELAKKLKDQIYIFYKDGSIHIALNPLIPRGK